MVSPEHHSHGPIGNHPLGDADQPLAAIPVVRAHRLMVLPNASSKLVCANLKAGVVDASEVSHLHESHKQVTITTPANDCMITVCEG